MNSAQGPNPDAMAAEFALDASSATPLYVQVRNVLMRMIRDGRFGPDEALPSERTLAERLGISRITARKAIAALVDEGLILRRHGSGSYVAPLLEQPLTKLTSFTEELRQRGFEPSSRWLRREVGAARPDELVALGLSPGARVARLERVRLADQVPMAFESSTLPTAILPNPESVKDSLYESLLARDALPVRALQHIRATRATPRHAALLDIPAGDPLLYITRVGYLQDGHCVELTHTWCRSDFYDFVVELRR